MADDVEDEFEKLFNDQRRNLERLWKALEERYPSELANVGVAPDPDTGTPMCVCGFSGSFRRFRILAPTGRHLYRGVFEAIYPKRIGDRVWRRHAFKAGLPRENKTVRSCDLEADSAMELQPPQSAGEARAAAEMMRERVPPLKSSEELMRSRAFYDECSVESCAESSLEMIQRNPLLSSRGHGPDRDDVIDEVGS